MKSVLTQLTLIGAIVLGLAQVSHGQIVQSATDCTTAVSPTTVAGCNHCGQPTCQGCGPVTGCPTCEAGCDLEIKQEMEKKTCFMIERKTICIPTVQLPFGFCCKPLSARSKTIKVLKTKSYEVPVTRYIWSKSEVPCGNAPCADPVAPGAAPAAPPAPALPAVPGAPAQGVELQTPPQPEIQTTIGLGLPILKL